MSCCGAKSFVEALEATGRRQVVVAGIEAHACVSQTVHDLIEMGYQVHVARDATSSRRAADARIAWDKMTAAGMLPTTAEQALLELVRTAEAVEFKQLQRLCKGALIPSDWT
jgi:nicotinamidase-related amidase